MKINKKIIVVLVILILLVFCLIFFNKNSKKTIKYKSIDRLKLVKSELKCNDESVILGKLKLEKMVKLSYSCNSEVFVFYINDKNSEFVLSDQFVSLYNTAKYIAIKYKMYDMSDYSYTIYDSNGNVVDASKLSVEELNEVYDE